MAGQSEPSAGSTSAAPVGFVSRRRRLRRPARSVGGCHRRTQRRAGGGAVDSAPPPPACRRPPRFPPRRPPPGPRSMTRSAARTMSRWCSTTITVCRSSASRLIAREEHDDIGAMQARGRLVQDVERAAASRARELRRELHPLRLSARERRRRLPEPQVAEAELAERAQDPRGPRLAAEQRRRLLERRLEEVVNRSSAVLDGQRFVVEAPAAARLADDVHLPEEVHADLLNARALAGFAAPARDVEREASLPEAPRTRLRQAPRTGRGRRRRGRCTSPGWTAESGRSATGPRG